MTKETFIALMGEDPKNMFGQDWENEIEKYFKGSDEDKDEFPFV